MTTIQDLADACGVSIATVSRAFSPNGKINEKTKKMILKRAQELHYIPNTVAKSLQSKQTYTIGLIIPEISNSFYSSVIQEMELKYRENGYRFIIGFYQNGHSTEADIIADMASYRTDALIFSPRSRSSEETLKAYFSGKNVLQLFTSHYKEYDSLIMDDIMGTAEATEYLIAAGHKRILYYGHHNRTDGYLNTMKKHGLDTTDLCYMAEHPSVENAIECIKKTKPTAILSIAKYSEDIISALRKLSLNFPEDISLMVYDDIEWTRMLDISAVAHPLEEIAATSFEMILHRLKEKGSAPIHRTMRAHLVHRNSVKKLIPASED